MAGCSGCMGRLFFFSSRRRHTRFSRDWSSDVCSSDLVAAGLTHHPYRSDVHGLLEQGTKEAIILEGGHVQVPAEKRPAIVAKPATKGTRSEERRVGKERSGGGTPLEVHPNGARHATLM